VDDQDRSSLCRCLLPLCEIRRRARDLGCRLRLPLTVCLGSSRIRGHG
jgi:hypothetical protein